MVDHLAVQLDLMASLVDAISQITDESRLADARELRLDYFRKHLAWPTRLLTAAAQRAESDFYRSVIEMTAAFLETERASLAPYASQS
jgi:TorA maturation chaperone TorD